MGHLSRCVTPLQKCDTHKPRYVIMSKFVKLSKGKTSGRVVMSVVVMERQLAPVREGLSLLLPLCMIGQRSHKD